jgi:DNA-binding beta-propeller fold protein YncE
MFGSLSSLSINRKEQGESMASDEAVSSPPVKTLLDEPHLIATIDTGYSPLLSVSCVGEDLVWTGGNNKTMKLLNLQGKLQTSIQTKSGERPEDIAMTRDGNLVYTDYNNKTVNLVKNNKTRTVITVRGWYPGYVCSTTSGDLLVTMRNDKKESKIVRYSGFIGKEPKIVCHSGFIGKQTIQYDDQGRPLYSSGDMKHITENRNLDICVADCGARAVVVVNPSGKLRFRYTGYPSNTEESFSPLGLTTDSQSHILVVDHDNHRIHILDQDGQFLCYITCGLVNPWVLCVDIKDNLFAAEHYSAKVKKIQYLQ